MDFYKVLRDRLRSMEDKFREQKEFLLSIKPRAGKIDKLNLVNYLSFYKLVVEIYGFNKLYLDLIPDDSDVRRASVQIEKTMKRLEDLITSGFQSE